MPFSIRVDAQESFSEIVLEGELDAKLLLEAALTLRVEHQGPVIARQLWDARELGDICVREADVDAFLGMFQTLAETGTPAIGRRALLVRPGYIEVMARAFAELLAPTGLEFHLFHDRAAAVEWLRADRPS